MWLADVVLFIDTIGQSLARLVTLTVSQDVLAVLLLFVHVAGHPLTIVFILSVICLIELLRHRDRVAVFYLLAVSMTWITVRLMKYLVGRERPEIVDSFLVYANGYAFPSGHTAVSTVIYGYLIWLLYKPRPYSAQSSSQKIFWRVIRPIVATFLFILIVLIGFSRVLEGVHWFTDVIAGWGIGAVIVVAAALISALYSRAHGRSKKV